jgi:hypothetical protein
MSQRDLIDLSQVQWVKFTLFLATPLEQVMLGCKGGAMLRMVFIEAAAVEVGQEL